jgi:hypothetical protein
LFKIVSSAYLSFHPLSIPIQQIHLKRQARSSILKQGLQIYKIIASLAVNDFYKSD